MKLRHINDEANLETQQRWDQRRFVHQPPQTLLEFFPQLHRPDELLPWPKLSLPAVMELAFSFLGEAVQETRGANIDHQALACGVYHPEIESRVMAKANPAN